MVFAKAAGTSFTSGDDGWERQGERNDTIETNYLSRKYKYYGPAWYQTEVEIPERWADKRIVFVIERTKHSTVWVDDFWQEAKTAYVRPTPHEYQLSRFLTPGRHPISIRVDNANHPSIGDPHQISDHTQTNWNGILGRVELRATGKTVFLRRKNDACVFPLTGYAPMFGNRAELMDLVKHFKSIRSTTSLRRRLENFYNNPDFAEGQDFWVTMRTGVGVYPVRGSFANPNPPLGHIQVNEPFA